MHAGGAIKTTTGVTIMSDIISELAGQFGIPSAQAESAAGSVLKFVQTEAGSGDFQKLLAAAPQIQGWIAKAGQGAASSGGGGLSGQLGGLAAALGGGPGGIAGRKSVVLGMSVVRRVEHGGARTSNKKKKIV